MTLMQVPWVLPYKTIMILILFSQRKETIKASESHKIPLLCQRKGKNTDSQSVLPYVICSPGEWKQLQWWYKRQKDSQKDTSPASCHFRGSVEISVSQKDLQQENAEECARRATSRSILLARCKVATVHNHGTTSALCALCGAPPWHSAQLNVPLKIIPWWSTIVWVHCYTNGSMTSWG